MTRVQRSISIVLVALALLTVGATAQAPVAPNVSTWPVSVNVYDRLRTDANDFYTDAPYRSTYPYVEQMLRLSIAQHLRQFEWQLELGQSNVFDVPTTAVSPVSAQGQLGLGGTYFAADGGNTLPVAASLRQGFLRYHGQGSDSTLRVGRFEFFEGTETTPKDASLLWLQDNRIQQRLIGNFTFSNGQRSFDGVDAHYGKGTWDITSMAGRAIQGVFNMNANPELNVDLQYLAFTKSEFHDRLVWRAFAIGYHDGRTGLAKTDSRPLAVRQADHKNIRLGTYGGDLITTIPAPHGAFDLLVWGVVQDGRWGLLNQSAGAVAVEGGYRLTSLASKPWLRGGYFRSTGDNDAGDATHNTFVQLLPTPRVYARFPFYNLMNNSDDFVQFIDSPKQKLNLRSDLHFLQLTSSSDLWYGGGGAYDNLAFGFTGRPTGGHSSFATMVDMSSDYQLTPSFNLNLYYAHSYGKSVVSADFPQGKSANFGYVELVYKWCARQRPFRN